MDIQIETSRLLLRQFTERDASAVSYNSSRPTVKHFMSDMVLKSADAALGWIRWINNDVFDAGIPRVVLAVELKSSGKCIGLIGAAPKKELCGEIEILFSVADEYHNKGYATEAGKAMIWWVFEQAGLEYISAIVKPENKASRRVIDKLGFIYGDTRTLPYDGKDCAFDFLRLYHTDYLPGPEWCAHNLYKPELMSAFFDTRADRYNSVMFASSGDEADYKRLGNCFPETDVTLRILDVGCGTGIELDYIWGKAPIAHITCVDISRGMLDLLLKNHPDRHDRITLIEGSYLDMEYPENAFDIVVSNMTMHHLWACEKLEVYKKIRDTLNPDGTYIEGDFIAKDDMMEEQYKRRYKMISANLPDKAKAGEYHIDIPLTLETQKKLLRDAGFSSVEVFDDNINRGNGAILRAKK